MSGNRFRLHAYHTERVLSRSPFLARLAPIATFHHERLDGTGYHRGVAASSLSPARPPARGGRRIPDEDRTTAAPRGVVTLAGRRHCSARRRRAGRLDANCRRRSVGGGGSTSRHASSAAGRLDRARGRGRRACSPGDCKPNRSHARWVSRPRQPTGMCKTPTPRSASRRGPRPPCSPCSTGSRRGENSRWLDPAPAPNVAGRAHPVRRVCRPERRVAMSGRDAVQLRGQDSISERPGGQLPASVSWAAWAGIIGPVLFTAAFLAQEAFRRGRVRPAGGAGQRAGGRAQRVDSADQLRRVRPAHDRLRGRAAPWHAANPGRHRRTSIAIPQRYRLAARRGLPAE